MCGIVGYVGAREACPILLGALARLEYRGYDSAGLATLLPGDRIGLRRTVGKLESLYALLEGSPLAGTIGIGHTRWATHGRPSEQNAHPHKAGPVAVIHNGIIENYLDLRTGLLRRGHHLKSETDTEVISHLIEERLRNDLPLSEAVRETVGELRGSFSIVVLSETEPGRLIAAKTATPLVIGIGRGENFIASDIPAILEHTRSVIVLDEGQVAEVSADSVRLFDFSGALVESNERRIEWDAGLATKGGFRHYLRKEISEQPQAWIDTLAGRATRGSASVRFEEDPLPAEGARAIGRIVIVGAGASAITSLIGKYMIEELAGLPVEVDYSSEFRYRHPAIDRLTMVIAVAQSGETADTLAAVEEARRHGSRIVAITNTVDSSMARAADARLYSRCGPEISVTTTKCFLTQLELFHLLAVYLGRATGRLGEAEAKAILEPSFSIPNRLRRIFEREDAILRIARKYADTRDFLYLGRGINYPVALEGALKLKEISYIHAEGYSAGEMKHGPIALVDKRMPVVALIPANDLSDKMMSNMKEIESRNGRIIAVTDRATPELRSVAEDVIEVPTTHRLLAPVLMTVPLQLLAYHIAVARGTDVDQPRNLAKTVTVE